jgi:2-oxoisovalerate dehydrogenase E1 component alpha subunit
VREAIARAARGDGPTLVEALTARMPPARDGAKDPNDPWKKRDPLVRVRRHLEARGVWSEAKQREHEAATLAEIDAAIELAERVAPPALGTLFDDVFQTPTHSLDEQREELLASPRATGLAKP